MRIARRPLTAAAVAAFMLFPATALAADYPPANDPGKGPKNPPKGGTLKVCKKGCKYKKIQAAIDAAGKGTTIKVGPGTYKEGLRILSPKKDRVKLIGNPGDPDKVILEGKGLKGAPAQNGVQVNNADGVFVSGFHARNFKGNGFFVVNADGYKLRHLIAEKTGVYGLYAFNSKGGEMSSSEAFYHNDAGFYVGQTPPQTKPKRTTLKNLVAWGNVLGYSGTNSRYVTITKSKFFNNGVGLVPNVLESEKFMPHEDNAIVDNDIFWNNFNFHRGKPPFTVRKDGTAALVPVGTGILLLGGRGHRIENNRIHGNFLTGVAAIEGILLAENPDAKSLERNVVRDNQFGLGGTDTNGTDLMYDGSGSDNCFSLDGVGATLPADKSTFAGCGGANAFSQSVQDQMTGFIGENALKGWAKHEHPAKPGYTPLEVYR